MNLSWRQRRQLLLLAIPVVPTLLLGGFLLFRYFTTASCYDGKINQGEQGVDCEGPCPKICTARVLEPQILWANAFPTLPGTYNLAAMVENRNEDLGIADAPISFRVFSDTEELLFEGVAVVDLRPSEKTPAFIGTVALSGSPARVEVGLEINKEDWQKIGPGTFATNPEVTSKVIVGTKTEPRVEATLRNVEDYNLSRIPTVALIVDEEGNAVAASRTEVDLAAEASSSATYTWPRAFPTTSAICQQPVDAMLAIDASGSMNSTSTNPPEPLTSVKNSAKRFLGLFSTTDGLGVVSFANNASLTQSLTGNIDDRLRGIESIVITEEAESGYTNIASALTLSLATLNTQGQPGRSKAIILLTDGLPTAPDGTPDPEISAVTAANQIAASGIELFVIGLGDQVNQRFLASLVGGDDSRVFKTSNVDELSTIYSQIASAVCERQPYRVEIYPNAGLTN